jgi:hypothetical protein
VTGEGVDEVLQLEEGTGEVRRGPKGADEGGTGELTKGERNDGAATRRWRDSGDPIGRHIYEAEERREGGDGVLRRSRKGGREAKERGGARWRWGTLYKRA